MDNTDIIIITCCQLSTIGPKQSKRTLNKTPTAANLGTVAKNAVTGVGDPS